MLREQASKGRRVLDRSEVNAKDAGAGRERNDRDIFFILLHQWTGSSAAACFGLDSGWTGGRQRCVAWAWLSERVLLAGTAVVPRIVSQLVCSSYCIGLVVVVEPATARAPPDRTLHAALAFARARVLNDESEEVSSTARGDE